MEVNESVSIIVNGTHANGHHHEGVAGYGLWVSFTVVVAVALGIDLAMGAQKAQTGQHLRAAVMSSVAWLSLGFAFAGFLACTKGGSVGFVFLTGYLIEKSLSVDNLVVIALIFRSFRIKPVHQGPVLKWGILGAVIFRTVFIFAGVWFLEHFQSMVYIFGGLLLWSAWKMYAEEDEDSSAEVDNHSDSWMMKMMTCVIPYNAEGKNNRFIETINGQMHATPMLAALVVIELSDLIFAVDSIPCILGLTHDLFLVFSSNMLAILGLRSLYLLLAEALDQVTGLKKGLACVLAFVGFKMMCGEYFPLPQSVSLLVIFGILGATVVLSMMQANGVTIGGSGKFTHSGPKKGFGGGGGGLVLPM
jgi:tellurite resistance protein TerC